MKFILYDFEVFKFDTLLGCKIIDKDKKTYYQTWNKEEMKKFYYLHQEDIWVGHNNERYDNLILEAIINDEDPFETSFKLINAEERNKKKLIRKN